MGIKLPQRFTDKMKTLLGEAYDAFIASYDRPRQYGLRVNGLKLTGDAFVRLSPFGGRLTPVPWAEGAYYYDEMDRPGKHPHYHAGLYYIQEPSAMVPGELLGVQPGDRVLDLCAAPGGKSTQLAAKLQGRGVLVANDNARERTKALAKNIELAGVRNAVILNEEPAAIAEAFGGWFDRILVDAPCSGEGRFRKDESMIHEWERHSVARCSRMQRDILRHAVRMLAPGGTLVYSTCTFSPEENEAQIAAVLGEYSDLEVVPVPLAYGWAPGRPDWAGCSDGQGAEAGNDGGANGQEAGPEGDKGADGRSALAADPREKPEPGAPAGGAALCGSGEADAGRLASLAGTVRLWPHLTAGEGHYAAVLRKRAAGVEAAAEARSGAGAAGARAERRGSAWRAGEAAAEARSGAGARAERRGSAWRAGEAAAEARSGAGAAGARAERRGSAWRAGAEPRGKGEASGRGERMKRRPAEDGGRAAVQAWERFAAEHLLGAEHWLGEPVAFGSRVYLQPAGLPSLAGLRVVRAGWYVGEAGPHRFQPSQPLAMGLRKSEAALTVDFDLDEQETIRYLKGETLHLDPSRIERAERGTDADSADDGVTVRSERSPRLGQGRQNGRCRERIRARMRGRFSARMGKIIR